MVWEKKKYFLFGINLLIGTSFTPINTSAAEISFTTLNPKSEYSLSE